MEHWDIKQAFVNAPLEETVYVHQVKGMERKGQEGKILLLKKALYGTKQAAHAWQKYLTQQLLEEGGRRNLKDECIFIFREGEGICIIGTHVDDIFPLYNKEGRKIRDRVFKKLEEKMEVENKGEIKYALDTCIERNVERGTLRISQENYIRNVIKEFKLEEAEGKDTPGPTCDITEADIPTTQEEKEKADLLPIRSAIGKLWWAALISRPDIICALHKCAAWQNKPSQKLWKHILWIIRYLKNTLTHAIVYKREEGSLENMYVTFCDASFASESESRSRIANIFFVLGCLVSWSSNHSTRVLTSSTEAEANSVVHTAQEGRWIKEMIEEIQIFRPQAQPLLLFQDNKGVISLLKGAGSNKRSRHFQIEFDALREYVKRGEIKIEYVETESMIADMFTKNLCKHLFEKHRDKIMEKGAEKDKEESYRANLGGCGCIPQARSGHENRSRARRTDTRATGKSGERRELQDTRAQPARA